MAFVWQVIFADDGGKIYGQFGNNCDLNTVRAGPVGWGGVKMAIFFVVGQGIAEECILYFCILYFLWHRRVTRWSSNPLLFRLKASDLLRRVINANLLLN